MVAFLNVIQFLLVLALIRGLLTYGYTQTGENRAARGCNAASNYERVPGNYAIVEDLKISTSSTAEAELRRLMKLMRGRKQLRPSSTAAPLMLREEQSNNNNNNAGNGDDDEAITSMASWKKRSLKTSSAGKDEMGSAAADHDDQYGTFGHDYDHGPMRHPPRNN